MGKLYLITGEIIENSKGMDAIVNAQNKYMIKGGGICGAIYNASGPKLEEYCKNNYKTYMVDKEVRITPGFNLNIDIIHVLAPKYYEQENPLEELIDTYNNLLESITNNNYKKVLIPSLGTGFHGYKHKEVANKVINTLYNYCINNNADIYFINLDKNITNIYQEELNKIENK